MILKDADGNVVVDGKGRPVKISIEMATNGTVLASYKFEEGTSQEEKDHFYKNAGRVINAMIQVKTGKKIVEGLVSSKDIISIEISNRDLKDNYGKTILGLTSLIEVVNDGKTGLSFKRLKIEISEANIIKEKNSDYSEQSRRWNIASMNDEQIIGSVGAHEGTHANEHYNGKKEIWTEKEKERDAINREYDVIDEFFDLNN